METNETPPTEAAIEGDFPESPASPLYGETGVTSPKPSRTPTFFGMFFMAFGALSLFTGILYVIELASGPSDAFISLYYGYGSALVSLSSGVAFLVAGHLTMNRQKVGVYIAILAAGGSAFLQLVLEILYIEQLRSQMPVEIKTTLFIPLTIIAGIIVMVLMIGFAALPLAFAANDLQ